MTFIMIIHAIVCVLLACIVLMQSGRGGGLTENFASAEAIFGAQTNSLLVRTTTVIASIFIITSLSLTIMHSMKGKSLMSDRVAMPVAPASASPSDQAQKDLEVLPQDIEKKSTQAVQKADNDIKPVTQDAVVPSAKPVPAQ